MQELLTLLIGVLGFSIILNLLLFWTSRFNNKHFDIYTLMDRMTKRKDMYISVYFGAEGYSIWLYPIIEEDSDERSD